MSVWVFWSLKYHISSSTKKPPIFYNTKDVEETFSLSYWLFFYLFCYGLNLLHCSDFLNFSFFPFWFFSLLGFSVDFFLIPEIFCLLLKTLVWFSFSLFVFITFVYKFDFFFFCSSFFIFTWSSFRLFSVCFLLIFAISVFYFSFRIHLIWTL